MNADTFDFALPSRPAPQPPSLDAFHDQLCEQLLRAVLDQKIGQVFPHLDTLARHYGIDPKVARTLRSGLLEHGYLARVGHAYLTAHPLTLCLNRELRCPTAF